MKEDVARCPTFDPLSYQAKLNFKVRCTHSVYHMELHFNGNCFALLAWELLLCLIVCVIWQPKVRIKGSDSVYDYIWTVFGRLQVLQEIRNSQTKTFKSAMCSKSPMNELEEEMLALCHKYELMNFQQVLDSA